MVREFVKSQWVRAEAAAAQRDNKLIPVKLADVGYEDIVQPFNLLHTEDLANREIIKAAVQAQLDRPAPAPLLKQLKFEALMWFGICGSVITLFTSMSAVLKMADWVHWLSECWIELTGWFWRSVWALFNIEFPKGYSGIATLALFMVGAAFGALIQSRSWTEWNLKNVAFNILISWITAFLAPFVLRVLFFLSEESNRYTWFNERYTWIDNDFALMLPITFLLAVIWSRKEMSIRSQILNSAFISVFIFITFAIIAWFPAFKSAERIWFYKCDVRG